jgi:signal transduction histidine kinase
MNLSINSLDAMEQGGILTFRTRFQGDGRVLLEVADTGLGVARVYGTVQALGGKVLLSSKPGEGTTACLDPATAEILGAVPRLRVLLKPYLLPQLLAAWEELLA